MEVWMVEGVNGVDAFAPVEFQKLGQQRDGQWSLVTKDLRERRRSRCELLDAFAAWQITPAGHVVFRGRANQVEYQLSLVQVAVASEYWLAFEHLSKHAAHTPHVNGSGVASQLEQKLWRTVPAGDHQTRVLSCCLSTAMARSGRLVFVWARKAKIRDLQNAAVVDQKIGCFHVSVEDLVLVQVFQPF